MKIILVIIALTLAGCNKSETSQLNAVDHPHKVTVYGQNGEVVRTFHATGQPKNEEHGGQNIYFGDADRNGKYVAINGGVVISEEE